MSHDVFISYSHVDRPAADAACAVLEATGLTCWMAPRDVAPGAEWAGEIAVAIDRAQALVLIFSSHANASRQVGREVELSISKGIEVIPLSIENVTPARAMAYYLAGVHRLDAAMAPLELHLPRLVAAVANVPPIAARMAARLQTTPKVPLPPVPVRQAAQPVVNSIASPHGRPSPAAPTTGSISYKFRLPLLWVVFVLLFSSPFSLALWNEVSEDGIVGMFAKEFGAAVSFCALGLGGPLVAIAGVVLRLRNLDNKRAFLEEIILYPDRVSIPAGFSRLRVIRFSEIRSISQGEMWPVLTELSIHTDSGTVGVASFMFRWGKFRDFRRRLYAACGIRSK